MFVPVFGESNCGWQCVLLRFGKIFFEYHLLFFFFFFLIKILCLLPGISSNFVYIVGAISVTSSNETLSEYSMVHCNSRDVLKWVFHIAKQFCSIVLFPLTIQKPLACLAMFSSMAIGDRI